MKFGVGSNHNPSEAIAAFLMLPEPCGVNRSDDLSSSVLSVQNYWLQSMWLSVDTTTKGKAIFTPNDCIFCGGVDKHGHGSARCFSVDFAKRFADVINAVDCKKLDREVISCLEHFAAIYKGEKPFVFDESVVAIKEVMKFLASKYPERYSGTLDPLAFICELSNADKSVVPPANVDRLSISLKLYAEKRAVDKPSAWGSYDAWTHGVRTEFAAVDEALLTNPAFDYKSFSRKYVFSLSVANTEFAKHSDAEKHAVLKFLKEQKDSPKSASWYIDERNRLVVGGSEVGGMSPKTVLYFMSELHPAEFAVWSKPTFEGLAFLGLHKGAAPMDLTVETYEDCKAKQRQIIARMNELGIGKATDDPSDPDYRTVNEFIWWLGQDNNKDFIKEKIMNKEFKKAEKKPKTGATRTLSDAVKDDDMMQRLMAALRTKPFAILAGHSGTGKSQLVRRLAYMTCNDEVLLKESEKYNAPGNYCMVQVKPNWHDSTDLLGYYTEMNGGHYHTTPFVEFICKAYAYPETPFFVCLDEMNLAPVEQYFAEFLSAIESYSESKKLTDRLIAEKASPEEICGETKLTESLQEVAEHGLTIPRNLFVVGTVNVDETTCQFSRKVLDRAMTILMTTVNFESMKEAKDPSKEVCFDDDGIKFFLERPTQTSLVKGQMDWLDNIQKQVGDTPFAIAYRFANEYALYQSAYQALMNNGIGADGKPNPEDAGSQKTAIDHVVLMKLLPRIHGSRPDMEDLFKGNAEKKDGLIKTLSDGQSVEMMNQILGRSGEYLSFWP